MLFRSDISFIRKPVSKVIGESSSAVDIINATGIKTGYGIVFGTKDIELLKTLVSNTSLSLVAFDNDPSRISYLREYFDGLGVKTDRLSFLNFEENFPLLPKYFSSLTVVNDFDYLKEIDKSVLQSVFESTRPFDGKIWLKTKGREQKILKKTLADLNLYGAELSCGKGYRSEERRVG